MLSSKYDDCIGGTIASHVRFSLTKSRVYEAYYEIMIIMSPTRFIWPGCSNLCLYLNYEPAFHVDYIRCFIILLPYASFGWSVATLVSLLLNWSASVAAGCYCLWG